jgi:adenylosuccinate lyase
LELQAGRNDGQSKSAKTVDYSLFSPTDFRYDVPELRPFLSEEAYVKYKAKVEAALAQQLAKEGVCTKREADEIERASELASASEVYAEEDRIKHDIRALANVIASKVSEKARPFVHLAATSYDIVDTANSARFRDSIENVVLPDLIKLENALIELALKYSDTVEIGRTHGQHAEPITFGFYLSYYVSRLGKRILKMKEAAGLLCGKFAGAVGVYGPLSLIVEDPEKFERELLSSLNLQPSEVSTQIVQPEPITDLMHYIVSTFGVMANLARDLRHLQRSEISEVAEGFLGEVQVGSSTMPHKRNPISFENVESMWKKFMPQMVTVYLDQVSEHQRDLTNSSSQRYLPELIVIFDYAVRRLTRTIWDTKAQGPRLTVDRKNMEKNLQMSIDQITAEPLYVLLAVAGHPNAHESVRRLVQKSLEEGQNLRELVAHDKELSSYLIRFKDKNREILDNPEEYIGLAAQKSRRVALSWKKTMASI